MSWNAGAPALWWTKWNSAVQYILLCESVKAAVTAPLHAISCVWKCITAICQRDRSFQVPLQLLVWFQLLVACQFQPHRIEDSRKNLRYSLNQQYWIIYSRLHKRIAVNCSTLLGLMQSSLSLIVQLEMDSLSDIELMYHILSHGLRFPSLLEEYSQVFPRSGMKLRYTWDPLSCPVLWSQIWHHTRILFNGLFWQYRHALFTYNPTPAIPLNRVYPLCITLESVAASTHSVIFQTLSCYMQARLIPLGPSINSESILDRYVKATA